jgi:hypothetical protein
MTPATTASRFLCSCAACQRSMKSDASLARVSLTLPTGGASGAGRGVSPRFRRPRPAHPFQLPGKLKFALGTDDKERGGPDQVTRLVPKFIRSVFHMASFPIGIWRR